MYALGRFSARRRRGEAAGTGGRVGRSECRKGLRHRLRLVGRLLEVDLSECCYQNIAFAFRLCRRHSAKARPAMASIQTPKSTAEV